MVGSLDSVGLAGFCGGILVGNVFAFFATLFALIRGCFS